MPESKKEPIRKFPYNPAQMIDLRSDTVTSPCQAMRRAMAEAEVGDDVYGEDPTVNRLQQKLAAMTGHEAALFFPSGTQSNLVALLAHCGRGDEYIVAQTAHTYRYEGGGAAALGGIQPQPLDAEADGSLCLRRVAAAIKADDIHFAKTRLLALENTFGGRVLAMEYIVRAAAFAREKGLKFHLDGARVFNAAVALGADVAEITARFDSVSVCLSKGLGAPVGSLLCGGRDFIKRALRWRKVAGGGMRQAGMLAAAGIHALDNNIARLADDHTRASRLAEILSRVDALQIIGGGAHTNMVFVGLPDDCDLPALQEYARARGLLIRASNPMRLVVHLHIGDDEVATAAAVIAEFFAGG